MRDGRYPGERGATGAKRRRHQLFEPAVGRQRPLERLLESGNFIGRERQAKVRPETIDLLQRRKADDHASPFLRLLRPQNTGKRADKRKKATRGPRRPRMASMPVAISGRLSLRYRTKSWRLSPRRHRLRQNPFVAHVFTHAQDCDLAPIGLVNQRPAPFLCCGTTNRAQTSNDDDAVTVHALLRSDHSPAPAQALPMTKPSIPLGLVFLPQPGPMP